MTLSTETIPQSYAGDGTTTVFNTVFTFDESTEVEVVIESSTGGLVTQTEGSDYTVSGGSGSAGNVTFTTAPASGETVHLTRNTPVTQPSNYTNSGILDQELFESDMDRNWRGHQEILEIIARCLKTAEFTGLTNLVLPKPVANQMLTWNSTATAIVNSGVISEVDVETGTGPNHLTKYTPAGDALEALPDPTGSGELVKQSVASGATVGQATTTDLGDAIVTTAKILALAVTTAKLADAAVTSPKIANGAVTIEKLSNAAQREPATNRIVNGNGEVLQQGAKTAVADGAYGGDNVVVVHDAAATAPNYSAPGAKGLGEGHKIVTQTANTQVGIMLPIDSAMMGEIAGGTASFGLEVESPDGLNMAAGLLEWSGTTDAITADWVSVWAGGGTLPTPVANWAFVSGSTSTALDTSTGPVIYEVNNLSISAGANNLAVVVWIDDTTFLSGATFTVKKVRLSNQDEIAPYAPRPYRTELDLCKLQWTQSYNQGVAPGTATLVGARGERSDASTAVSVYIVSIDYQMRANPTVSFYDLAGTANSVTSTSSTDLTDTSTSSTIDTFDYAGDSGFGPLILTTALRGIRFHYTADARIAS